MVFLKKSGFDCQARGKSGFNKETTERERNSK